MVTLRANDYGLQSNMRQSRESSTSSLLIRRSMRITADKEVCDSAVISNNPLLWMPIMLGTVTVGN